MTAHKLLPRIVVILALIVKIRRQVEASPQGLVSTWQP